MKHVLDHDLRMDLKGGVLRRSTNCRIEDVGSKTPSIVLCFFFRHTRVHFSACREKDRHFSRSGHLQRVIVLNLTQHIHICSRTFFQASSSYLGVESQTFTTASRKTKVAPPDRRPPPSR